MSSMKNGKLSQMRYKYVSAKSADSLEETYIPKIKTFDKIVV